MYMYVYKYIYMEMYINLYLKKNVFHLYVNIQNYKIKKK